jgi:hypothetical protein
MKKIVLALLLTSALPAGDAKSQVAGNNYKLYPNNCSGTIATAATAQTAIAAGAAIHGWALQNLDTGEPLWFSVTGTAAAAAPGSFVLGANTATTFANANATASQSSLNFPTANALSIVAATLGHKFSCIYW